MRLDADPIDLFPHGAFALGFRDTLGLMRLFAPLTITWLTAFAGCGNAALQVDHVDARTPANPVALEVAAPSAEQKAQIEAMLRERLGQYGPFARVVNEGEEAPLVLHVERTDGKSDEATWLVTLTDRRSRHTLLLMHATGTNARAAKLIVDTLPRPGPPDWEPTVAPRAAPRVAASANAGPNSAMREDGFDETTVPMELRCLRCSYVQTDYAERLSPRDNYAFNKSLATAMRQLHDCIGGRRAPEMRFRYDDRGRLASASVNWDRFPLLGEEQSCLSSLPTMRPNVRLATSAATEVACFDECGGHP